MSKFWKTIVRWRTWLVNTFGAALFVLPGIIGAPEILAVIPTEYHRWVFASIFIINLWMRPRPAAVKERAK